MRGRGKGLWTPAPLTAPAGWPRPPEVRDRWPTFTLTSPVLLLPALLPHMTSCCRLFLAHPGAFGYPASGCPSWALAKQLGLLVPNGQAQLGPTCSCRPGSRPCFCTPSHSQCAATLNTETAQCWLRCQGTPDTPLRGPLPLQASLQYYALARPDLLVPTGLRLLLRVHPKDAPVGRRGAGCRGLRL